VEGGDLEGFSGSSRGTSVEVEAAGRAGTAGSHIPPPSPPPLPTHPALQPVPTQCPSPL
jgi:hypothetical protein